METPTTLPYKYHGGNRRGLYSGGRAKILDTTKAKLKNQYLGNPDLTMRDIAKLSGISLKSVSNMAVQGNWYNERQNLHNTCEVKLLVESNSKLIESIKSTWIEDVKITLGQAGEIIKRLAISLNGINITGDARDLAIMLKILTESMDRLHGMIAPEVNQTIIPAPLDLDHASDILSKMMISIPGPAMIDTSIIDVIPIDQHNSTNISDL